MNDSTAHVLKTWPEPFSAILNGLKAYEIRKADRDYRVGDILQLTEWDPGKELYTGRSLEVRVTYMTPPGVWGLPTDVCVMGIADARAECRNWHNGYECTRPKGHEGQHSRVSFGEEVRWDDEEPQAGSLGLTLGETKQAYPEQWAKLSEEARSQLEHLISLEKVKKG